ncbi:nucleoporin-like protein 2 [Numida meleagris]|uniref:nucleoporin-like protein 2 n=1 Tax=Numida meleagris TaxID=8996 RepID=UPI000B3E19B8|nr:nucleoporin-like protein 2 [Numida meleagris]
MAICRFFLQGRCHFGDRCWNEHPRGGGGRPHSGDGGGLSGASGFGSAGNKSAVFSQNRFSALSSASCSDDFSDEERRLLDCIAKDMATWESSGQWMFSCYSPMKDKPNVSGFREFSPEEVRLEYYNCRANNNTQTYINSVNQLAQQWKNRLQELKALNASGKASMLSELKNAVTQPLPSLGFGGQQASSIGMSSKFLHKEPAIKQIFLNFLLHYGNAAVFQYHRCTHSERSCIFHNCRLSCASGHNVTSAPSAVPNSVTSDKLYTPRSELTAEELKQFEAKRFTMGKIPLKPPPADLLYV